MGEDKQNKPQPLFGDNDIRHSVETVNERWEREMSRRKRLATKIVLPVALVLVCTWLVTAKIFEYFPFQHVYEMPPMPEDPIEQSTDATPVEKMGNSEAKIQFTVVYSDKEGKLPEKILAIFHEATDTKPSQLYAEVWDEKHAPQWLKDSLAPGAKFGVGVNGNPVFDTIDNESKLINLINDYYSTIYKDDKLVINPATYGLKQPTEEELKLRSEKRIEREKEENLTLPSLKFER
ncbi:MAG: hypothetical protein J5746_06055 [Victivallales bacterium]|nr:hypothetical protein [Victivallales bacterium]